jgi:ABC-2 type transport system permease protein
MLNGYDIKTVFSFFFKAGLRSKRAKLFFIISLFPTVIFTIVRIVTLANPNSHFSMSILYTQVSGVFYFQLFIQFLSLFYGSAVISDEVDNKTLVYLTTSSVSRGSVLIGKFLAHFLLSAVIVEGGIVISFAVANFSDLLKPDYLGNLGMYTGVALLAIAAYSGFFTMLGTLMKKSVLVGIFFIFGWESVVQFFPGITQKLTLNHYIKSLLPVSFSGAKNFLAFLLQPSTKGESISVLILMTLIFLAFAVLLFYKKEFLLSDES